jgi:hypothetical protein
MNVHSGSRSTPTSLFRLTHPLMSGGRIANSERTLYTAYRDSVRGARLAAAEFAIFQRLGFASPLTPERLAGELSWQSYW